MRTGGRRWWVGWLVFYIIGLLIAFFTLSRSFAVHALLPDAFQFNRSSSYLSIRVNNSILQSPIVTLSYPDCLLDRRRTFEQPISLLSPYSISYHSS